MFKRKHYKFTNRKTSKRGVASTIIFIVAFVFIVAGIYMSFKAKGNGGMMVGVAGMAALVLATIGVAVGVNSLKDEDVFHAFSWIGAIGNAVVWIFLMLLIMIGL